MKDYYIRAYVISNKGGHITLTDIVPANSQQEAIQSMYDALKVLALKKFGTTDGRYNVDICYKT